jgi:hypothetical protein
MDMKKILQAIDGQTTKPQAEVGDMARFVSIIAEGAGKLNRLTAAESIAVNHYTEYKTPSEETKSKPSLIDKYFKQAEQEFAESQNAKTEKVKQLAERVSNKVGNFGHQSTFKKHISQSQTPPENIIQMAKKGARVDNNRRYKNEETDPVDTVTLDIPLLLRIMEYSKEDAQDDMALHDVTQRLIELSKKVDVIDMSHYDAIVSGNVDESLRTDNPCWKGYKPVGTKKKGGRTVPNCVPK